MDFLEGTRFVIQIFVVKLSSEKYMGKKKKLYAAFVNL